MIAVDTSALLSAVFGEADGPTFLAAIARSPCIVGAPTVVEARMVVDARGTDDATELLDSILSRSNLRIVPFDADHAALARVAFASYGKGSGHPARLNFGDCMTYAVAKRDDLPLLFKGGDFVHTDLRPARGAP